MQLITACTCMVMLTSSAVATSLQSRGNLGLDCPAEKMALIQKHMCAAMPCRPCCSAFVCACIRFLRACTHRLVCPAPQPLFLHQHPQPLDVLLTFVSTTILPVLWRSAACTAQPVNWPCPGAPVHVEVRLCNTPWWLAPHAVPAAPAVMDCSDNVSMLLEREMYD